VRATAETVKVTRIADPVVQ